MYNGRLPEDCAQQWEILLLLLSSEEKKIGKAKENEINTMEYFFKNEGIQKIFHQWLVQMRGSYARNISSKDTALKSEEISLQWRQHGNEKFRNNEVLESYFCYTKSVRYAKLGGEMYPLAVANRSATLVRLKRFEDCLADIELAINNKYPNEQRHKLLLRQADCYIELHQQIKAMESINAARTHAQSLKLSPTNSGDFEKHIKIIERKWELLKDATMKQDNVECPRPLNGENPNFVGASTAIEIRCSDSAGRFVATNTDLQRGDILFVEEPYAFVTLHLENSSILVCDNCCKANINPVPCKMCSRSIYCSERCRRRGWETFHHWECVGAQSNIWPTIGIAHLALRVLLISTSNGFPQLTNVMDNKLVTVQDVFAKYSEHDPVKIYSANTPNFYRMFGLITNFDKMSNVDYVQYALTAMMVTIYLETFTKYFDYLRLKLPFIMSEQDVKLFVSSLLLRHMGQLVCNGHAIMSLQICEENRSKIIADNEIRIGTAIYPSASMMNHSCDPNIINSFYNCCLVVRCGRELASGGEVLNCYGPSRSREPTSERKAILAAQYHFNCECCACNDPTKKDFLNAFNAYACPTCKGPVMKKSGRYICQQCRSLDFNLEKTLVLRDNANDLIMSEIALTTVEEKCEILQNAHKLNQQILHRHHTLLRDSADRLANLYFEMGEYTKSVELIKQNIPSYEYQFGSFSVEVAHELRKLAAVMLDRVLSSPQHPDVREWCLETHKIIKKAFQLVELNYGGWDPVAKRLKIQESYIAGILAERRNHASPDNSIHNLLHYNLKI